MGRPRKDRVPIAGPAGTYRAGRKSTSALYEELKVGGATVTIRYPSHFGKEQIVAARLLAFPTAEMAQRIRERWQRDERDSSGRRVLGGHNISGGMWAGLQVRTLRNKVYANFFGRSAVFRRNGVWKYPPQFADASGRWAKRDPSGRFLPAEEGERVFVPDLKAPIRKAPDRPVKNAIKAQASTQSDGRSILEYSDAEREEFGLRVRDEVLAYLEQAVGAFNASKA